MIKAMIGGLLGMIIGIVQSAYFLNQPAYLTELLLTPLVLCSGLTGLIVGLISNLLLSLYSHIITGIIVGLVLFFIMFQSSEMYGVIFILGIMTGTIIGFITYLIKRKT